MNSIDMSQCQKHQQHKYAIYDNNIFTLEQNKLRNNYLRIAEKMYILFVIFTNFP